MALARMRFLIAEGGCYMAAVLSLQRLPQSRYVVAPSAPSIRGIDTPATMTVGDGNLISFPTSGLDGSSASSSNSSTLSLLESSVTSWPTGSQEMMAKAESAPTPSSTSSGLPFSTWLPAGEDPWGWCTPVGSAIEAQKTLTGYEGQQQQSDFTTELGDYTDTKEEEEDGLVSMADVKPLTTTQSEGNMLQLLDEEIFN